MNEIATSLCAGLVRTTLILSAAALLLPCVLMAARCRSAAVHRFGVCLVLLQGWMFAGVNVCVPVPGWWPSADTGIHVRT
ncbi:MAG TPA: hypothetical protein VML55_10180, partial [Planctomycetaceae bacterium]|nr:hypothetical protein [Planctomycetaceae bacterium]